MKTKLLLSLLLFTATLAKSIESKDSLEIKLCNIKELYPVAEFFVNLAKHVNEEFPAQTATDYSTNEKLFLQSVLIGDSLLFTAKGNKKTQGKEGNTSQEIIFEYIIQFRFNGKEYFIEGKKEEYTNDKEILSFFKARHLSSNHNIDSLAALLKEKYPDLQKDSYEKLLFEEDLVQYLENLKINFITASEDTSDKGCLIIKITNKEIVQMLEFSEEKLQQNADKFVNIKKKIIPGYDKEKFKRIFDEEMKKLESERIEKDPKETP